MRARPGLARFRGNTLLPGVWLIGSSWGSGAPGTCPARLSTQAPPARLPPQACHPSPVTWGDLQTLACVHEAHLDFQTDRQTAWGSGRGEDAEPLLGARC